MGASVVAYWSGISDEQLQSQPGFYNGATAWATWAITRESTPELIRKLRALNVEALCTYITDGLDDAAVAWVSPVELEDAATRLRNTVMSDPHSVREIISSYAFGDESRSLAQASLSQDLGDVACLAAFARTEGVKEMTLLIGW